MKGSTGIFALTGRSGSGKSKVSALFRSCGIPVLDCDVIAREVTGLPACKKELALRFGSDLFLQNGSLDRRLLASRAFSSKENTAALTAITHPYIVARLLEGVQREAEKGAPYVVVDGSTILDGPFAPYCDKIIVVDSTDELRIERILRRDKITKAEACRRLLAQPPDETFRAAADLLILNNGDERQLEAQAKNAVHVLEGWNREKNDDKGRSLLT